MKHVLHGKIAGTVDIVASHCLLCGFAGNDTLFGGKRDDRLVLSGDGNFFQSARDAEHDRASDFEQGIDLTDGLENASDGAQGVVFTPGQDGVTIEGISRAELVGGDFILQWR